MANGINFELRANELGIPATKHLGEVPILSEPQHSLCKRWKPTGVLGELSGKMQRHKKCLAHSRSSTHYTSHAVIKVEVNSGSLRKQSI